MGVLEVLVTSFVPKEWKYAQQIVFFTDVKMKSAIAQLFKIVFRVGDHKRVPDGNADRAQRRVRVRFL